MKKTIFFLILILSYSLSAQTWGNREYWISYEEPKDASLISALETFDPESIVPEADDPEPEDPDKETAPKEFSPFKLR